MPKSKVFVNFRISLAEKELIQKAAILDSRTLSGFFVKAAIDKARLILRNKKPTP